MHGYNRKPVLTSCNNLFFHFPKLEKQPFDYWRLHHNWSDINPVACCVLINSRFIVRNAVNLHFYSKIKLSNSYQQCIFFSYFIETTLSLLQKVVALINNLMASHLVSQIIAHATAKQNLFVQQFLKKENGLELIQYNILWMLPNA